MSAFKGQVLGWLRGNRHCKNFQFEFPKMKFREFVRVPMVSDWAEFAVQISKDEASTPSTMCPYCNFENSQHLSNSTELQTKDIAASSKQ